VIGERHGLASAALQRASAGTHVVWLGEREVVKLFAPWWPDDFAAERRMLEHVGGRLPIATPRIVAVGELEGWPYLVITRLEGRPLDELWPALAPAERRRLLASTGELVAALHALPLLPGDDDPATSWAGFVATRREKLAHKHAADGLGPAWIEDIERTVAGLPVLDRGVELACLHTDMQGGNLLARSVGDRVELSGLFDFGDAMVGAREHELIAPAAFMAVDVVVCLVAGDGELYGSCDRREEGGCRAGLSCELVTTFGGSPCSGEDGCCVPYCDATAAESGCPSDAPVCDSIRGGPIGVCHPMLGPPGGS
jgi:hygromycin-B 7''-O-kinase